MKRLIMIGMLSGWLATLAADAEPGQGEPLDLTRGEVHNVTDLAELKGSVSAANSAGVPATILVGDGVYTLDIPMLHIMCPGLVIRSASGDRGAVTIRGPDEGPEASLKNVFLVSADDVVIADITLGYCRWHGVQAQGESPHDVSGLHVHNCRLVNCNEQFIKGSSAAADPVGVTDGIIENCLFEFTSGWAYQYYTGGIDIHKGVNWQVRDNLFRNIRNPGSGITEHAIHFWKRCTTQPQNIIVERNHVINCDRGIGFGLGAEANGHNGGTSTIRNNMIWNDGAGPNTDVGIGLESANDVTVDNNTVFIPDYWAPIEYRFAASTNLTFRNNLVDKAIRQRDGAPLAAISNTVDNAAGAWFRKVAAGDLRILPGIAAVIDQGAAVPGFSDDVDGDTRPVGAAWDVGADEYDPQTADSDGDGMTDGWETGGGLDPLDATGDDGPDGDPDNDQSSNSEEFDASTRPDDPASRLAILTAMTENGGLRVTWQGGIESVQVLERRSGLAAGEAVHVVQTYSPPTPEWNEFWEPLPASVAFYQLRVRRP